MPGELPEDELFTLSPAEFVKRRNELVKALRAEGRKEDAARVGALARPSPSAWALNKVARTHPERIAGLLDAHEALRNPRDPQAMREATERRNRAVAAIIGEVSRLLDREGHAGGPALVDKVTRTLLVAGADEHIRSALTAGRLSRDAAAGSIGELAWGGPAPVEDANAGTQQESADARRADLQVAIGRLADEASAARAAVKDAEASARRAAYAAELAEEEAAQARRKAAMAQSALERKKAELEAMLDGPPPSGR